jgi:hypothetical protein
MLFGLDKIFEILTTGADVSQFISLSKNIADEKLFKQILKNQDTILRLLENKKEIDYMKILKNLIDRAECTMEEVEWYAEKAHHLRTEHKSLADTYIKIAEMHVTIYNMLHEKIVALIEEEKQKGVQVPSAMQAIWDYEHEKLIKEFMEARILIEEYKKLGY